MAPDPGQESRDHASSGGWYPGEEEPHAWAGDGGGSDLLPGLDPEQGSRGGTGGGSGGKTRKKGRRRVRVILLAILTVFVLLIVAAGGVGYHYYKTYIAPPDFSGPGTGNVVVQIKPGQFADQIGLTLASDGVVASARAFSNAAKASPQGNALEPGFYQVHQHMKASLALALLLKPSSREETKITIPEGFRVAQIIALLGKETGDLKGYEQAIAHPGDLGLPRLRQGQARGVPVPGHLRNPAEDHADRRAQGHGDQVQSERAEHRAARPPRPAAMSRRRRSSRWRASSRPRASAPRTSKTSPR